MARETLSWWGICVSVAVVAAGGCSGSSGTGGDHGRVIGGPGQSGGAGGGGPALPGGSTIFAVQYGDEGGQQFGGIASDADGNIYVVGREDDKATPEQPEPPSRLFILKYSPSGVLLWREPIDFSSTNQLSVSGIAVQPTTGAVILAGTVSGTANIGGTTLQSDIDPRLSSRTINVCLAAYDSAGTFLWARSYPSNTAVFPNQVFTTGYGDIELFGGGNNNATVGGAPLCCREGEFNGPISFVARYSPIGDFIWSNVIGGDFASDHAAADVDGGMVIGGSIAGTMTYQGESFSGGISRPDGTQRRAGVVLRLDGEGHKSWSKVFDTELARIGPAVDAANNVILWGAFRGTLDFGGGISLTASDSSNPFLQANLLAKLAPDGTAQWAQQFPPDGPNQLFVTSSGTDGIGNIVLGGEIPDGVRVAKYAPDGGFLWSRGFPVMRGFGASGNTEVTVTVEGDVGFGGEFHNTVDFGTGPLTVPGEFMEARGGLPLPVNDVFVVKLAP